MLSAVICLVVRGDRTVYYTARDGICVVFGRSGVFLTRPVLKSVSSYVGCGSILQAPFLHLYLRSTFRDSLLHAPCCNLSRRKVMESLSYTPRAVICLAIRQERSLSYTPAVVIFFVLKRDGSFSFTSSVSSFVGRGIPLTRSVLLSVFS